MLAMDIDKHLTFFAGAIDTQRSALRYVISGLSPPPVLMIEGVATFLSGGASRWACSRTRTGKYRNASCRRHRRWWSSDGLLEQLPRSIEEPNREQVLLHALSASRPTTRPFVRAGPRGHSRRPQVLQWC